jgi:hypothetical protein
MREIHTVYPQLEAASDGDPGRVTEGFYIVENDTVVMTNEQGVDGYRIIHKLKDGENARAVAARLTLKIFHSLRDDAGGFNRPTSSLKYPKMVY